MRGQMRDSLSSFNVFKIKGGSMNSSFLNFTNYYYYIFSRLKEGCQGEMKQWLSELMFFDAFLK